jgi:SAM-dependent methyltransferase
MNWIEYKKMYDLEDTHWWYVALHRLVLDTVRQRGYPLRILDAGCGTGGLCRVLAGSGSVQGCDAALLALYFCAKRGVRAIRSDLNTAVLEPEGYDVITSLDVLYHRNIKNAETVVRKMYSALKPGGTLILQVPAYAWMRSSHDDAVHTGRRYTRKQVEHMMRSSGFSIEKATYRVTLLFIPIALTRLARKLVRAGRIGAAASDVKRQPPVFNAMLSAIMYAENSLLKYCSLPFGASVFAVARKPPASDEAA